MKSNSFKAAILMVGPISWIAFAAGLQMLGALMFFHLPIDVILIITYFFMTFSVYLLNRFTDHEDSYNYPDQKIFFQSRSTLKAIPIIFISLSIIILALTNRLVAWHAILIIGGILYSVSVIPFVRNKSLCFIRLKDIFFIKNAVVSLLWGITPFAIAAGQKNMVMPEKTTLFVTVLAFCLTTLITAIAYDVPDAEGDRYAGIKTIATRFGKKYTGYLLFLIGITGSLFVGIAYATGKISAPGTLLFFTIILWTAIVAIPVFIKKPHLSKSIIKPLLDSQCVFCGASLIVFSFLLRS